MIWILLFFAVLFPVVEMLEAARYVRSLPRDRWGRLIVTDRWGRRVN